MIQSEDKIKTLDEIAVIRNRAKKAGKTVVTTNGSYDIIHSGHVRSLEESKLQGDILIVGINSDKSVRQYKSKDRPIISEKDRAIMVAGLGCVDYVFLFDETTPMAFLEKIKPDIHANGADYGVNCIERPTVEKYGGKLYILKKYSDISTSKIINKIIAVYGKQS